jgi:hypothetical protein
MNTKSVLQKILKGQGRQTDTNINAQKRVSFLRAIYEHM